MAAAQASVVTLISLARLAPFLPPSLRLPLPFQRRPPRLKHVNCCPCPAPARRVRLGLLCLLCLVDARCQSPKGIASVPCYICIYNIVYIYMCSLLRRAAGCAWPPPLMLEL